MAAYVISFYKGKRMMSKAVVASFTYSGPALPKLGTVAMLEQPKP